MNNHLEKNYFKTAYNFGKSYRVNRTIKDGDKTNANSNKFYKSL